MSNIRQEKLVVKYWLNCVTSGDEQEKSDYLRALERISQKHKVGGKWNKNLLHKNIKDPEVKCCIFYLVYN